MTMAAAAVSAPVPGQVLSWADRLLGVAASIGMRNTDEESPIVYHKGSECRGGSSSGPLTLVCVTRLRWSHLCRAVAAVLNDIIRFIRTDSEEKAVTRQLGEFETMQRDLIPLLIQIAGDPAEKKTMFSLLRVIAFLTLPASTVFSDTDGRVSYATAVVSSFVLGVRTPPG